MLSNQIEKIAQQINSKDDVDWNKVIQDLRNFKYKTVVLTNPKIEIFSYNNTLEIYNSGSQIEILGNGDRVALFKKSDVKKVKLNPNRSINILLTAGELTLQR